MTGLDLNELKKAVDQGVEKGFQEAGKAINEASKEANKHREELEKVGKQFEDKIPAEIRDNVNSFAKQANLYSFEHSEYANNIFLCDTI